MRWFTERLVMLMTVTFVVLAVAQAADASTLLFAGAVALASALVITARNAALTVIPQSITISNRARQHREALSERPAPEHPDTAGRPRTRAPSQSPPAA